MLLSGTAEQIILVDENNRALGRAEKLAVHRSGLLHRAFSVFLCDRRGQVLLQQRHPSKYHSGGLWSNSCCGHPRPGERTKAAAARRVVEELGVEVNLTLGFRARYRTSFANGLHENELVYVYFGRLDGRANPNPREVADLKLLEVPAIRKQARRMPEAYAYWFRYYLESHSAQIAGCVKAATEQI
jgi:isopentenyl-diphosphate Delta-isomerase